MLLGLNAIFNERIGEDLQRQVRDLGFDMERVDATLVPDPEMVKALADEVVAVGLEPLVIFERPEQIVLLPPGTHVEFYNEPNLDSGQPQSRPEVYRDWLLACLPTVEALSLNLWGGSVSNFNEEGLAWLEALDPKSWPDHVSVSMHWYPDGTRPPFQHKGFRTRDEELDRFFDIVGERRWGNSEFGFGTHPHFAMGGSHDMPYLTVRWTDEQVAEYVGTEWGLWAGWGAHFALAYQLNDGASESERYGFRATMANGQPWKPVAATVAAFKGL